MMTQYSKKKKKKHLIMPKSHLSSACCSLIPKSQYLKAKLPSVPFITSNQLPQGSSQPEWDLPSHKPCSWQQSFICSGNRHLCSEVLPKYNGGPKSSVEVPLNCCNWKTVPANQVTFSFFSPAWVLGRFQKDIRKDFSDLRFCLSSSAPLFYLSTSYYIAAFTVDKRLHHDQS